MDTQGQQHPIFRLSQDDLQQLTTLMLIVMAQFDDHTISQLRENQQYVDELARVLAQQLPKAVQTVLMTSQPEWTVEQRRIEDLVDEEILDRMDGEGLSFGRSYTMVNRNGEQVLYLLSEYYDNSVLEAAKEDDFRPPSRERLRLRTYISMGDQHVAMVEGASSSIPKTIEAINNNIDRQKDPDQSTSSPTSSSEPRIEFPTYLKGVLRARR